MKKKNRDTKASLATDLRTNEACKIDQDRQPHAKTTRHIVYIYVKKNAGETDAALYYKKKKAKTKTKTKRTLEHAKVETNKNQEREFRK